MKKLGPALHIAASLCIIAIIAVAGWEIYSAYMANHGYYFSMLKSNSFSYIGLAALISACLPVLYLVLTRRPRIGWLLVSYIGGLVLFSCIWVVVKSMSVPAFMSFLGPFMLIINTCFFVALSLRLLFAPWACGHWLHQYIWKSFRLKGMLGYVREWVLGMITFLVFIYICLLLGILRWPVSLAVFLLMSYGVRVQREKLYHHIQQREETLAGLHYTRLRQFPSYWIIFIMILAGVVYLYYGYNLAYIPYPTAWDANHAYMYYPKIWAENAGIFWSQGPSTTPHMWHVYISYWFSWAKPFSWFMNPDTIAVQMNFLTGPLVGIVFVLLAQQAFQRVAKEQSTITTKNIVVGMAVALFLLRLTSGMGAFLVFVDNKTDLALMFWLVVALLFGIKMLNCIRRQEDATHIRKLAISTGIVMAIAVLIKPTALQDVVFFGLLLMGSWISVLALLGVVGVVVGVLAYKNFRGLQYFDLHSVSAWLWGGGTVLVIVGWFLSVRGIASPYGRTSNRADTRAQQKSRIVYGLCRLGSFVAMLVLVKTPRVLPRAVQYDYSPGEVVRQIFLVQNTGNMSPLPINDQEIIAQYNEEQTPAACLAEYSDTSIEALEQNLVTRVRGGSLTEDFGRYVWASDGRQRTFLPPSEWSEQNTYGPVRIGYYLLDFLLPDTPGCYTTSPEARLLCENTQYFENGWNRGQLQDLLSQMNPQTDIAILLEDILSDPRWVGTNNPDELLIPRKELIDAYQHRTIQVLPEGVFRIPYKFLMHANIVFNWSLQNPSSYYTDIGFVWLISMLLLIIGLIYSICVRHYRAIVLHAVALSSWWIWALVTHAIVWYALGVIVWTILAHMSLLFLWYTQSKRYRHRWIFALGVSVLVLFGVIQYVLNIARMSNQGAAGSFVRYRSGIGQTQEIVADSQRGMRVQSQVKYGYGASDLFALQFGHYQRFIDLVEDRSEDDGVYVAGTYLSYFLPNQHNLRYDGLLTRLGRQVSDEDICKTAVRLHKNNIRYLVIDPNIVSVATSTKDTLFTRYLAELNPVTGRIVTHGVMSMIARMVEQGYIRLVYSNNLAYAYAYGLSNQEIGALLQSIPDQQARNALLAHREKDSIAFRAQMGAFRFFPELANYYQIFIQHVLFQRVSTGSAVQDIAGIRGMTIRTEVLQPLIQKFVSRQVGLHDIAYFEEELTDEEKQVLYTYLQIISTFQSGDTQQAQQIIQTLLQQSIGGSSQLVTFELLMP